MAAMNEILASQVSLNAMAGTGSLLAAGNRNVIGHNNAIITENGSSCAVKMEEDEEEENENTLEENKSI